MQPGKLWASDPSLTPHVPALFSKVAKNYHSSRHGSYSGLGQEDHKFKASLGPRVWSFINSSKVIETGFHAL